MSEVPVMVEVPGGPTLEARLFLPAAPRGALVVCHPHPLYGGDMENPVVIRASEVAQEAGLATLRFNFRGVGGSGGQHDGGKGERDDVQAALDVLAARVPAGTPRGLAGYSFGAWVAARLAAEGSPLAGLCLIAPPLGMFEIPLAATSHLDTLVVAGTRDGYCPLDALTRLTAGQAAVETAIIDGADHFFFGKLFPLGEAVARWARRFTERAQGR